MRKCLIAAVLFSFLLSGCGVFGTRLREPVTFYYLLAEYRHGTEEPVFAGEQREASGHLHDLSYLMALYLMGPSSDEMVSPLPKGTRIITAKNASNAVVLDLSDTTKVLSDIQFTLACTCLSMTCFELVEANTVTVNSGERSITIPRDSLVLTDKIPTEETK